MRIQKQLGFELGGSLLYAVGIGYFLNSAKVAPGGVSGIALMIGDLWAFPIGTATLIMNLPIITWGWFVLGRKMMLRTLRVILISSVLLDAVAFAPHFGGDRLLSAVFGGIFTGGGIGLIFYSGATTGGVDVLSYILKNAIPSLRIGMAILIIDSIIIASSVAVYGELEAALYGIISLWCTTKVIDMIIYGTEGGSNVMIISDKSDDIVKYIMDDAGRGVTLIDCRGGRGGEYTMVMCAIRKRELSRLRQGIAEIDNKAFMICTKSGNIYGEGFED